MNNILPLGKDCCGCNACEQICPKKCITFKYDNEGFSYPEIDETSCVNCGACIKHCPILSDAERGENPDVYAAKLNDRATAFKSTSGGVFVPLAESILKKNGVVFGCAYDENLVARHIAITDINDLIKLQCSKYVQSDTSGIYSQVKKALTEDRYVLFSGTGCQVAGLKTFLGKDYPKLFTVDIVCHGVPSGKLFSRYLEYLGGKMGGKITSYSFRSKEKKGWDLYYKVTTKTKSKSGYGFFDPYYNAFLNCKIYRESCYSCKFANSTRPSEITLADFWGIEKINPDFYDKNGVSLVLVNNKKGTELWNEIVDCLTYLPSTVEKAVEMNGNLAAPSKRPACRDNIYDGLDGDINKYVAEKLKMDSTMKKRIKMLVPVSVKGKIKHILKK